MKKNSILPNIRIRKITLSNFRNIVHTEVDIPGGKLSEFVNGEPSILGLYGQNGSGKTSLLMALNALKTALSGREFDYEEFASCIRSGCENAKLEFELSAYNEKGNEFDLYYTFDMAIDTNEIEVKTKSSAKIEDLDFQDFESLITRRGINKIQDSLRPQNKRIIISNESLQFAYHSPEGEKLNKQVLIDTSESACKASGKPFGNKKKYEQLTLNCDFDVDEYLYKAKIESNIKSKSFIFNSKVVKALVNGSCKVSYKLILWSLSEFGTNYLFVILMGLTATNNMKKLPLSWWINDKEYGAMGHVYPLELSEKEPCRTSEGFFPNLKKVIESISQVISKIVPNLSIEIEDLGSSVSEGGADIHLFNLLSVRNDVRIPLAYESDGIRRIISFLGFIIAAYNNPSVTIAIDEIDSGIFEYMLGELIIIMKDSAKGQLIFTSHNLRPLEVLPYRNLLFTTINPKKRFTKLEGISGNNNLRDSYFRNIILGNGKNAFYDSTDSFYIEQALFEAGLPLEEWS